MRAPRTKSDLLDLGVSAVTLVLVSAALVLGMAAVAGAAIRLFRWGCGC